MKAKYYGARPARNVYKGGQQLSLDEYNREFKGDPYNLKYKKENYRNATGYMSADVEEYHRVPEQKDLTSDSDEKNGTAVASRAMKMAAATAKRKRMLSQAVVLLVASIIIVSSYQAMASRQDEPTTDEPSVTAVTDDAGDQTDNDADETTPSSETEATSESVEDATNEDGSPVPYAGYSENNTQQSATESAQNGENAVSWEWSSDNKTAYLIVKDSDGNVISKTEATITSSKDPATCNKDGKITYTATAEYDGKTYTDTKSEKIAALGHKFDKGKEVTLSDGSTAMEFKCDRCGGIFRIKNSLDEE